jgi:hypothetical protein
MKTERSTMRKLLVVLLSLFVCRVACAAQTLSPAVQAFVKVNAPVVALTHVRVIDGTGAAAREDQTVILSKGKIESVGDASAAKVPSDAQVLDLHGYSVIPGLVGMHDHIVYPMGNGIFGEMAYSFPRLYLAGGVTTIRTTGALEPYTDLELKKQIDAGQALGPKIHVTGPYLEGAGSWALQMHQLSGPEDATKSVNFWLDQGVDNFKRTCSLRGRSLERPFKRRTSAEPRSPDICVLSHFARRLIWGLMTWSTDCSWTRNFCPTRSRTNVRRNPKIPF